MKEIAKKFLALIGIACIVAAGVYAWTAQYAQVQIMGKFDGEALLVSPDGEVIDLRQEGPILVTTNKVEDYTVRLQGEAEWVTIMVSSRDGEAHYLFLEGADGSWITHTGITALTMYNFD